MADADGPRDERGETPLERADRNLDELLGELRVALPGVQVLFAFLLTVPFTARFERVTEFQREVYFVTLLCAAAASVLLIAPTAHHRIHFRRQEKEHIVKVANGFALAGLVALALAMIGVLLLITDVHLSTEDDRPGHRRRRAGFHGAVVRPAAEAAVAQATVSARAARARATAVGLRSRWPRSGCGGDAPPPTASPRESARYETEVARIQVRFAAAGRDAEGVGRPRRRPGGQGRRARALPARAAGGGGQPRPARPARGGGAPAPRVGGRLPGHRRAPRSRASTPAAPAT